MAENALMLLCSSAKIERDRGNAELSKLLVGANDETRASIELAVIGLIQNREGSWESKHGGLMGTKSLLNCVTDTVAGSGSRQCSEEFAASAKVHAFALLEADESRVRMAAGEVMGALCRRCGPSVYESTREQILAGVKTNLERQVTNDVEEQATRENLADKLANGDTGRKRKDSIDADQIFHDTAGWKSLETWMKCLQAVIEGCGSKFNPYIDQSLLDLILETLDHTNRFVRETGYYVCSSLVSCNYSEETKAATCLPEDNAVYLHGQVFSEYLAKGLADNWSQVRLAASVASRKFLTSLPEERVRKRFYSLLLPPICLNRYYVAEGVRIYNQQTWKMVAGKDGKEMVESYIKETVAFYISQSEADNHAVREAACACIAELGKKVSQDVVRPYVPQLLDALLVCFKDESWPVRDASCVACGNFVLCFPEESRGTMDELLPLFYENLQDNIPSVRQGAAVALGNVMTAYGRHFGDATLTKVREGLAGVEHQSANTQKYSGLEKSAAVYGVAKRLRDNDMDLHTDQQMYSCGSLAPKMHRGTREGGCMDHKFRKPPELWELADGCVMLLAEMAKHPDYGQEVAQQLPLVAKATTYQQYSQHLNFLETVCHQLPVLAERMGKRSFKMYLEMFFDAIFYSLTCDSALTQTAASDCLSQLGRLLGPNILKGRVEQYNPRYMDQLELHLHGGGPCHSPTGAAPYGIGGLPYGAGMPGPGSTFVSGSPPAFSPMDKMRSPFSTDYNQ